MCLLISRLYILCLHFAIQRRKYWDKEKYKLVVVCVGVIGSVWHWQKNIQGVPKILGQISRMSSSQRTRKHTCSKIDFEVKPPRSPELNPSTFLSGGTLKVLLNSVAIENEETLHQLVLRPLRPIANTRDLRKCATVHDQMCPCVHWFGWKIFWEFLVNCNLVNNKNWTVIGLGMCIVNVMLVLSKILRS